MYRPLFRTSRLLVDARFHDGKFLSVESYKLLGRKVFFLHVDGGPEAPLDPPWIIPDLARQSRWFAVDFSNDKKQRYETTGEAHVFAMNPERTPYLHFKAAKNYKRDLLGGLLDGETWWLAHSPDWVVFSNEIFYVSAVLKNSRRQPVRTLRVKRPGEEIVSLP